MESVFLCYNPYMSTKIEKNEKGVIKISVRDLVEFILREGDIDNRHGRGASAEAMLAGGRIHRKIQKRKGSNYHAEVPLKIAIEEDKYQLVIEGRADGILIESATEEITFADNFNHRTMPIDCKVTIDEIKGMYMKLDLLEDAIGVHRAQAMCYAYIYALQHDLSAISVQMTYCNLDTEDIRYFHYDYTFEELADWFEKLIDEYKKWADFQFAWKKLRQASIKPLQFPFPYRDGQRELVAGVYRTIKRKKNLFIQAPTGAGKTISTVFPAVKAVGEDLADKIFYLTAKTITGTVAREAFELLRKNGYQAKVLTITAKEKLCLCEEMECNPINCPYAKGHYDRVNDAVFSLLQKEDVITREVILEQAKEYNVCPFEMCLDTATWVDDIICDYNYVFDPNVYLKRFFGEGTSGEYIFLIDEAHNLVDRGREMYSAHVDRADVLEAKKLAVDYSKGLVRALEKVNRQLRTLEKECTEYEILPNPGAVSLGMLQVMGEMDKLLEELHGKELPEQLLEFYFCVRDFLNIDELLDENYVVYTEMGEGGKVILRLFCVNPAANIHRCLEKGKSAVFFSATLLPMDYYRALLSTRKDDYGIYVTSPFRQENRCILTGRDVSSRYTRRGYEEYHRIASYIARTVWTRKGNYMVFFPSYKFMEDVLEVYENEFSAEWVRCISQTSGMNEREKEEFLEEFSASEGTLVGFCVMGGIFSEGIDLMGEKLIGAIIIGTGLPQIGTEREILRQYYDKKGVNGFDYAYRYPGMNKVLQSAGRVIRTQEDTGIILLLDERFTGKDYRNLFPAEWSDRGNCTLNTVEEQLGSFWNRIREKN